MKDCRKEITASPVSPAALAELVKLVESAKITGTVGKKVFATMFESGRTAAEIVAAEGLSAQVSDAAIEQAAREVIAKNPDNVAKYKSGNEGVFKFLVGQVMKATRGQANPQTVNDTLRRLLYPTLKEQHEKAVGDSFFDRYNEQQGTSYVFSREGKPPEPDLVYEDKTLGTVGVEITSTYLNEEEGKFVGQLSRGELKPGAVWTSGTISAGIDDFASQLLAAIQKKLGKTYSLSPTWLVVDFNCPLGQKSEAAEIVGKVAELIRSIEPMPFAQIWVVWQIPNVQPAQYEVFQVR